MSYFNIMDNIDGPETNYGIVDNAYYYMNELKNVLSNLNLRLRSPTQLDEKTNALSTEALLQIVTSVLDGKQERSIVQEFTPGVGELRQGDEIVVYGQKDYDANAFADEIFELSLDKIAQLNMQPIQKDMLRNFLGNARNTLSAEEFLEHMKKICAGSLERRREPLLIDNGAEEPRVEEVFDDLPVCGGAFDMPIVPVNENEPEEPATEEVGRGIPGCGGVVDAPVLPGCGGAVAAPRLPHWTNLAYRKALKGRQSIPKLLSRLSYLEGAGNKLVTNQTKLNKQKTYGMLFGLLNKSVGEYSKELRNPTCNRTVSGTTVAKAISGLAKFSLVEQAKVYFAAHNRQFMVRARQLNDMIKKPHIESLQDDLKWAVKNNFRNARPAEKNELRTMLSDEQRIALGIRAPRK